jgi:hypothetical protein
MTDFGVGFRSSEDVACLRDRVDAARARFREAAERYVLLRRAVDATRLEAQAICARTSELRESLRDSVGAYVVVLRRTDVPPERAIVLVKSAVVESDPVPDKYHRQVIEEAVRWAIDAYYAA